MDPTDEASPGRIDTGLLCLVLMLRFFEMPADPDQLRHEYARNDQPFSMDDLLLAARRLQLKARIVAIDDGWKTLRKGALPAIARMRDDSFCILLKLEDNERKVLVQDVAERRIRSFSWDEFADAFGGSILLLTRRDHVFGRGGAFDIRWFIPAIVRYQRLFGEVLLASFFLQLFALISPLFFQVIIDKVLVHRSISTLDVLIAGLVVVTCYEVLLGALRTYLFSHTTYRVDVELGSRLFAHLIHLPMAYFDSRQVGHSVARVRELENIRNFITGSALTVLIDVFFTFVFFAVMWYFSPLLTLIVLGSIPLYVAVAVLVTPILRARLEEQFQRGAKNQAFLVESITGIETLKALAVEPQAQRRWDEMLAGYISSSFKTKQLGNISSNIIQLISKASTVLTLYFGAKAVIGGELSVGQLVAFNMLSGRVAGPIIRLAQLWNDFQQARVSIDRLADVLNSPAEIEHNPNRTTLARIDGDIRLERVTYRYRHDGPEVLRQLDLDIPAGQVIGIVGPSGSGKSTVAKLIQRMYVPESGRVLVDGVDLALVDTSWLRRQVGVVLQENMLFNASVRANIALSDPGMPMERVVEAARLAGAHDFIVQLQKGYDTEVGERGTSLSGGQRQRIAIARALVTNPRILIFDEATSALDYESERIIQENMRRICAGRTVLIIAHRLLTVRGADRILTIVNGSLVEDGTHEELVRANRHYAHLHRLQSGDPVAAAAE
jgi:subfamily B ATP-binding cassette protein HlyB/CyaB